MKEDSRLNLTSMMRLEAASSLKTVVFVGNGAIKGGWLPLRNVLDKWISADTNLSGIVNKLRMQDVEAFHQLALFSYKARVERAYLYRKWKTQNSKMVRKESFQKFLKRIPPSGLTTRYINLRNDIAQEYQKLNASLSIDFNDNIQDIVGNNACFMTTNWDNTLWKYSQIKSLIHLHGRCDFPDSLVIPTELVIEDIVYDIPSSSQKVRDIKEREAAKIINSMFRSQVLPVLIDVQSRATKLLKKANKVVIWGYSLADYDADINALIGTYAPKNRKDVELVVINPDPATFHRAVALTGITNAAHFNPITNCMVRLDVKFG